MSRNTSRPHGDPSSDSSTSDGLDEAIESLDREAALERFDRILANASRREQPGRQLLPGAVLGEFELKERLGAGGMAIVFRATQRSLPGRPVAVKVMRRGFGLERRRFLREISIISRLEHEAIVPIVAAGVEDGIAYFAMRYISGTPVSRLVRSLQDAGVMLPNPSDVEAVAGIPTSASGSPSSSPSGWRRRSSGEDYARWAAQLIRTVAAALQYAHEKGVVHRDVKPGNIILNDDGRPVLVDFGLASEDPADEPLTRTSEFLGTLAYASPEQIRGEGADTRSDVYSLGATLHEILALRRPFEGSDREAVRRHILEDPPASLPRRVPADLRTICRTAMEKKPTDRYATPGGMADDLRAFLAGRPITARPPGAPARLVRLVRRYPTVATAAMILALAFVAAAGYRTVERSRSVGMAARHVRVARDLVERAAAHRAALESLLERARREFTERGESLRWTRPAYVAEVRRDLGETRRRIEAFLSDAAREAERALDSVPDHEPARSVRASARRQQVAVSALLFEDLLDPASFRSRLDELRKVSPNDEWLDQTGWVRIDVDPRSARVRLRRLTAEGKGGGADVAPGGVTDVAGEGATDVASDDRWTLPSGSYVAEVSAPGCVTARLPFVVRRLACDRSRSGPCPPRVLELTLPPAARFPKGFLFVPGGWSVLGDAPPRVGVVEPFWIQEFEVTFDEWCTYLDDCPPSDESTRKPRYTDRREAWLVRHDGERWKPTEDDPRSPVRGVNWYEAVSFAQWATRHRPRPDGWRYALPTNPQWTRAARGADARNFPWGDEFVPSSDRTSAGGFPCAYHASVDETPPPVTRFPTDRSPFGVRGMAGSVHEATRQGSPVTEEVIYRGGSFRSLTREELEILALTRLMAYPRVDAGVRLVLEPLPAWMRVRQPSDARAFFDDFERPDGPDVGNGWAELRNFPCVAPDDITRSENCSIENGALVLQGGRGTASNRALVARAMPAWEGGVVIAFDLRELTVDAMLSEDATRKRHIETSDAEDSSPVPERGLILRLESGFRSDSREVDVRIRSDTDGSIVLYSDAFRLEGERTGFRLPCRVELRSLDRALELRIRPTEDSSATPLRSRTDCEPSVVRRRILTIGASNLMSVRAVIDDVYIGRACSTDQER